MVNTNWRWGQLEKYLIGRMLREQNGSLATAGGTQVEALAGKRPEALMATVRVGTADPRHTLQIVAARREPVTELLDALKAEHAVGGGVFLVILLAEVGEVLVRI